MNISPLRELTNEEKCVSLQLIIIEHMEHVLEITVIIAHILTVCFAAKTHRWAWLFSLLSCGIMAYFFAHDNLFVSSIFNAYGAIMAIIGFCTWKSDSRQNEETICHSNTLWTLLSVVLLTGIIWIIDKHFSHNPLIDSACTAMNIIATFLLVKKDINAWYLWIITDAVYIYYGCSDGSIRYIVIYSVMLVLAIFGLISYLRAWRDLHKAI